LPASAGQSADAESLISHILDRFHAVHRADLAGLVPLARKVESVHEGHPQCPKGLGDLLEAMRDELEAHMTKEEQVLFPTLLAGGAGCAPFAIRRMRLEHDDHTQSLAALRELTSAFDPPAGACGSWRALYDGCAKLDKELREHIELENGTLFPLFE
jgi:regulator of cell morphogenesis and NO signaling